MAVVPDAAAGGTQGEDDRPLASPKGARLLTEVFWLCVKARRQLARLKATTAQLADVQDEVLRHEQRLERWSLGMRRVEGQ
ncbi:MAG TPA: hypothetical protein DGG94_00485 [Micromonosporaceae bacterium]|nr:hypothetical protein [Micromonosporaceae bacterium]HCU48309.1 hypothetical protein [Micromonosporaceae bacterium]